MLQPAAIDKTNHVQLSTKTPKFHGNGSKMRPVEENRQMDIRF